MVIDFSKRLVFLIFIFVLGFASASFSLGNTSYSISTSYGAGQNITGWVNISFNKESGNSTLENSDGDSITLLDLLKKTSNSAFVYNCTPSTCTPGYVESEESSSKTFNIAAGESALVGFKLTGGKLSDITSFKMDLTSNNAETETFPLSIDILNNNISEWEAYSASANYSSENFGCYINTEGQSKAKIASIYYCEKIELKRAPAVEIGAYVNYIEGGTSVPFDLKITKVEGGNSQTCSVTATGTGRIACIPSNFKINEDGDYYVCIKAKNSADANKYEINYEQEHSCGFTGSYSGTYDYDFEIFERSKKYSSNINFTLNDTELDKADSSISNIESYMENYVEDTYDDDCSNGCIIPLRITAGVNQQVTISNLRMIYVTGISRETNNFYEVEEQPTQISSGYQRLYLTESGLTVPDEEGDYALFVSLNDQELFEELITVGNVPEIEYVTPLTTAIKYPTEFSAGVTSDFNITSYEWNFGDGNTELSSTNKITHTYEETGNYNLTLTIKNSMSQTASETFSIKISPASEIVPSLLQIASESITSLEKEIDSFSGFKKTSIQNAFDIGYLSDQLLVLKDLNTKANTEDDYENILEELLKLDIPNSVSETSSGQGIIFYPEKENIDLDVLKGIGGGTYSLGKEDEYKDAILSWEGANSNISLSFTEISAIYSDYQETAVRIFEITITKTSTTSAYLVIKDMENLLFDGDYSTEDYDGYKYIQLNEGTQKIVLSTTDDINFLTLPIFISPSLTNISIAEWSAFDNSGNLKKWIVFTIIAIGIILCTFIVYLVLQIWYKRRYESYLFSDRNNLYNLVNYVKSSREKEIKNKDIEESLKKVGWTPEQIRYVMRKFEGKNTGMPEIPIKKILKEKEKKKK